MKPGSFWFYFCQVRGTPGTGKTSLCTLLACYIQEREPTTYVMMITTWSFDSSDIRGDRWQRSFQRQDHGLDYRNETVFIFDEAQSTYTDTNLWNDLFKCINNYPQFRVILFSRYGSPTTRYDIVQGTPIIIPDQQRVSLRHIEHGDNLPAVGLFFTRTEFDKLVSTLYTPESSFDPSFLNTLFDITSGHVGAIIDFMRIVLADDVRGILCISWWWSDIALQSYRAIRNQPNTSYTWTMFLQQVRIHSFVEQRGSGCIFSRGLPRSAELQDLTLASVAEAVLCRNVVRDDNFTTAGEKEALSRCFRNGWLHTEKVENDVVGYSFPSSLHRWYVEQKLWGPTLSTPVNATSLLEFSMNVIRLFSVQMLVTPRRIGPGFIQRPPEAQFQDEFYRCSRKYSKSSFTTFPEYGTKSGWVDFYIPTKQWAIELLRDGNRLEEHSSRFLSSGAYSTTIPMTDYIILDFRGKTPKKCHPSKCNLFLFRSVISLTFRPNQRFPNCIMLSSIITSPPLQF